MTLIALAITVAYVYSSAVVFGLDGEVFYWELATLISVMLLGHWLEMRSVMSASSALEELARLMPSEAHQVQPDGTTVEVPLDELKAEDRVLVKPGEKIPADGIVTDGITSVNEAMLTGESVPVRDFRSIPGKGVRGTVNGREVLAVSPGYLPEKDISAPDSRVEELTSQGKTVIYILIEGRLCGAVALADIIRPESRQAVAELKEMGIRPMMITGDNQRVARWVAAEIGLDEYFAEVLPEKKAEKVQEVQSRGIKVAMTGDGVNDAPALARADVGIAIGAGTDVAVAAADVVLVRSNPLDVVSVIKLSRATYRKMLQNLVWAAGYNVVAIPLAAGVAYGAGIILEPAVGAALMALSTVIVAVNARILRIEK